jgi:DNA-binding NarL/FixJ family response regulator
MKKAKIIICEDHQLVIDGLLSIFSNNPSTEVISYSKNGNEIQALLEENKPDVLLLDLNVPGKNGLEILKETKLNHPEIKVIVLTMYNNESIIEKVIDYNANAYLIKNCSTNELFKAIDHVQQSDEFYLGSGINRSMLDKNDKFYKKVRITPREKEIIKELAFGLNVPKIADKLHISPFTVETHKKNIFKKLNIHQSIELLKFINEDGIIF